MSAHRHRIECCQLKFMVGISTTDWFQIVPVKSKKFVEIYFAKDLTSKKDHQYCTQMSISINCLHGSLESFHPFVAFGFRFHVQRERSRL